MIAPAVRLYDCEKKLIDVSQFRGQKNVLLLFFPLAFTSTCTAELCSVRDDLSVYQNEKTEVFGISVDSVYALAAYKEKYGLNYPLLSDFNKTASTDYDVLYDYFSAMKLEGVSKRAAFVIDRAGVIEYSEVLENANDVPDFNQIRLALQFID